MDDLIVNPEDLLKLSASSGYASYLLNLLSTCTLSHREVREIESSILDGEIKMDEIDSLVDYLKDAQVDRIDAGHPYSMKYIHEKLKKMGL